MKNVISVLFFEDIKTMRNLDRMWTELPNDRASTPIKKRSSFSGPRTSTPKTILLKNSIHRIKKKKKKKKQFINNDYRLLLYEQQTKNIQNNKHFLQIWFL